MNFIVSLFILTLFSQAAFSETAFDSVLMHSKLQLPIPKEDGKSGVKAINWPELGRYESEYFKHNAKEKTLLFQCPDHGAVTEGAKFPRTELRDLKEWTMTDPTAQILRGQLRILKQPNSKQIVFAQIHGNSKGSEVLKVVWRGGEVLSIIKVTLGKKDEIKKVLLSNLALGSLIDFEIQMKSNHLKFTIGDAKIEHTFDDTWTNESLYFKAGNYLCDNSNSGSSGEVLYSKLERE